MVFDPTVTPKKAGFIFRALFVLGVFALLHGEVFAAQDVKTQPNPYLAISERNAFDLTDAPPPAKNTPPPELPKNIDLKFTGIYRLKGVEKACLALVDSSTKPPETKYLQIPVGDKQGAIEITAIDAEAGTVNLIKDGSPLELSLKNNEHTYKTAVAKAPSKSSKSRSSSSKTSSRSLSGSRPTTGRSSGTTSSRSGSSPSRTSSSRSGSVSSLGGTRTTRAVPARRTYPTPPPMKGGDPAVQALEMMEQKDFAEKKGVRMPPLPFQQLLEDAPPGDVIRGDRPPMPPVPGGRIPPIPPGG
ncbi:MAG TPA: hypothetical protein EYG44_06875 [Verrucomicrobia bacterium]|nr:hypothetical protein [Verrucomicrobiota bacterium]